jgi:hypothetical protein
VNHYAPTRIKSGEISMGKDKAIPVTDREGPWGCETSRLPHFLIGSPMAVRLSASRTGSTISPGRFLVLKNFIIKKFWEEIIAYFP